VQLRMAVSTKEQLETPDLNDPKSNVIPMAAFAKNSDFQIPSEGSVPRRHRFRILPEASLFRLCGGLGIVITGLGFQSTLGRRIFRRPSKDLVWVARDRRRCHRPTRSQPVGRSDRSSVVEIDIFAEYQRAHRPVSLAGRTLGFSRAHQQRRVEP
jgi:hypothetical protein